MGPAGGQVGLDGLCPGAAVGGDLENIFGDVLRPVHQGDVVAHEEADVVHNVRLFGAQVAGVYAGDEHLTPGVGQNFVGQGQGGGAVHGGLAQNGARVAGAEDHRSVFTHIAQFVRHRGEQGAEAAVLPTAGGAEQDMLLPQTVDVAENGGGNFALAGLEQSAVDVAGDEPDGGGGEMGGLGHRKNAPLLFFLILAKNPLLCTAPGL